MTGRRRRLTSAAAWLTVIALLMGWTPRIAAQDKMAVLSGPIHQAITREAVRTASEPSGADVEPRARDADWTRVSRLKAGSEISLTVRGAQAVPRYFVSVDDVGITVLNLTDPALPAAVVRALGQIASQHPDYLAGVAKGGTFLVGRMRLAPTGVFMADQKVADLQQLLETHARPEVAEITTRHRGGGIWGHLGPLGGYFVGGMAGGLGTGAVCQAMIGTDRCDTGAFLSGMLVGGVAGGLYGFHAARRETQNTVYRAPQ